MDLLNLFLYLLVHAGTFSQSGYAPRYDPGVMERVAIIRHMPKVDCMISSPTLPLGTWLYVYGKNTKTVLLCRVTDVSAPKDKARHIRTKRIVELGYTAAIRLCGRKNLNNRPEQCPVTIVRDKEGIATDEYKNTQRWQGKR